MLRGELKAADSLGCQKIRRACLAISGTRSQGSAEGFRRFVLRFGHVEIVERRYDNVPVREAVGRDSRFCLSLFARAAGVHCKPDSLSESLTLSESFAWRGAPSSCKNESYRGVVPVHHGFPRQRRARRRPRSFVTRREIPVRYGYLRVSRSLRVNPLALPDPIRLSLRRLNVSSGSG